LGTFADNIFQVSGINIGPVYKRDIMRASTMYVVFKYYVGGTALTRRERLERAPEFAVALCFDVPVDKDAEKLANDVGLKIFKADIIYQYVSV
jgi:translation initiation factor 5B